MEASKYGIQSTLEVKTRESKSRTTYFNKMKSMGAENFHPEQNLEEQIESTTTIREILKRNTYREDNEEQNYSMEHNGVTSGVGGKFQRVPPNETREPDEVVDDLTVTGSVILEASRARGQFKPRWHH
ncbi:hypothetical protein JCM33374_g3363 [Metschnikowia sp. JCM 33374]|nr:hypothetical protein JCM33374_g3363 [Metschnikowia sp. JCM 33374]